MTKTLRIFAKDARHLWPEILLSLALTAGFAATEHLGWRVYKSVNFREAETLSVWMNVLMPIAWWFLIARAIHDESLVGDRQFWVTRPYTWQRVLGAKLIFVAIFILLPFLLAECFILHQAGLHPFVVVPGLLLKLVLLFAFVLLPLLALSTVTPSLTRMLLICLAVIIYILLAVYITTAFGPAQPHWTPMGDIQLWASFLFLVPVIAAVVTLLQYARRRTLVSNWLLVGLVVLLTFAALGSVYVKHENATAYSAPAPAEAPPLRLEFNPDPAYQSTSGQGPNKLRRNGVEDLVLFVPFHVSGIAPGHAVRLEGKSIAYEYNGGVHGKMGWYQTGEDPLAGDTQTRQEIYLPPDVYRQTAGKSITFHLTYAVSEFETELAPFTVPFNGTPIDVPQHGHCRNAIHSDEMSCQYAIKGPQLTRISWQLHQTCGASSPADHADEHWIGRESSLGGFSPVVSMDNILNADPLGRNLNGPEFCPGEPLTFTRYRLVRRRLIEVTLPPIDPQRYVSSKD